MRKLLERASPKVVYFSNFPVSPDFVGYISWKLCLIFGGIGEFWEKCGNILVL